jgi:hypothetical protein
MISKINSFTSLTKEMMGLTQWTEKYLHPIQSVIQGTEPADELKDGFAGFVLDGILSVELIHGEEITDWECIELIEELITEAKQISGRL